jgi:hypothetical protein
MLTVPARPGSIVTEHAPWERVHVCESKVTLPLPDWDQLTVPVDELVAVAVQMIYFDEPATLIFGVQETVGGVVPTVMAVKNVSASISAIGIEMYFVFMSCLQKD